MCHCYHGNQIGKFQFLVWYRYNTCVAIRLHVKSEGMANTLVTMETDRQQFHNKNPILKVSYHGYQKRRTAL